MRKMLQGLTYGRTLPAATNTSMATRWRQSCIIDAKVLLTQTKNLIRTNISKQEKIRIPYFQHSHFWDYRLAARPLQTCSFLACYSSLENTRLCISWTSQDPQSRRPRWSTVSQTSMVKLRAGPSASFQRHPIPPFPSGLFPPRLHIGHTSQSYPYLAADSPAPMLSLPYYFSSKPLLPPACCVQICLPLVRPKTQGGGTFFFAKQHI